MGQALGILAAEPVPFSEQPGQQRPQPRSPDSDSLTQMIEAASGDRLGRGGALVWQNRTLRLHSVG